MFKAVERAHFNKCATLLYCFMEMSFKVRNMYACHIYLGIGILFYKM
jgi:hypothetical protein